MILDKRTTLCDATALPLGAASTDYQIGDVISSAVVRDIGNGKPVYLVIKVDTAATSGTSAATAQFRLASDSTQSMTVATATIHAMTGYFTITNLTTVGTTLAIIPLPPESDVVTYEKFFGLIVNVGTESFTAGKIDAFLVTDPNVLKLYADAGN